MKAWGEVETESPGARGDAGIAGGFVLGAGAVVAGLAGAGLDEVAGVVGPKPGKAGFAILGFSGFGSAGEIGSYVGGFVGVTSVLVVTWVTIELIGHCT